MSKQRWIAAVLMVALAAAAIVAPGETEQASAVPVTALDFVPAAIALENDGDFETVNIMVTGLGAGEADTAQINIQHGAGFTISSAVCGPLYTGGFASGATPVTGGTAFLCSLQNGPTADASGIVASFDIMKVGDTTGEVMIDFQATGGIATSFYQAGTPVSPGTLGSLAVWDLLENVGNQTVDEGAGPLVFDVTSTLTGTTLTLSHSVTGPGTGSFIQFFDNLDNTGTFTITPTFTDAGIYTIDVTADNGTVSGTETFTLTVNDVNVAPEIVTIGDDSVAEGASLPVSLSATDADGDGLTYTATIQKGAGAIVAIPTGFTTLTDNGDGTGALDFNPGFADSGTYTVVVTVTDDSSASNGVLFNLETFTLTVDETNVPPVLATIGAQSTAEGVALPVPLGATDEDGDGLAFTATIQKGAGSIVAIPDGVFSTITDNGDGTGALDFIPGFADFGTYTVVVTVTDNSSASNGVLFDSETFTLTVNNIASISAPAGTVKLQGVEAGPTHDAQFTAIAPEVDLVLAADGSTGIAVLTETVDPDGSFSFSGMAEGVYLLRIRADGYLTHVLGDIPADEIDVTTADFDLAGLPVEMRGGLVIPGVPIVDGSAITTILGSLFLDTSTGLTGRLDGIGNVVDINGNGVVEGVDVSTAISNMGLTGDQPWS